MEKLPLHPPLICKSTDTVLDVTNLLRKNKSDLIFVHDENEKIVGFIQGEDLKIRAHSSKCQELTAKDVLNPLNGKIDSKKKVKEIYELLKKNGMTFAPIFDGESLKGVVYSKELMEYLDE